MGFCLIQKDAKAFKEALLDGTLNPERLADMSSKERRDTIAKVIGDDNAREVNRLFESKLLLKNQQQGIITWAEKVLNMRPEAKRDLLSRVERMKDVLQPENEKAFLEDLAAQRLGTGVSFEEAQKIADLAAKATELKTQLDAGKLEDRREYGRAQYDINTYVSDLKNEAGKLTFQDLKDRPVTTTLKVVTDIPSLAKSVKATGDNSAIFRQGWRTMLTNPVIWQRNAVASFGNIVKTFGGQNVMREIYADILSRPNYDKMKQAKIAIGNIEDEFPTSLPEKIPFAGRVFKASEVAYNAFLYKTRADLFDKFHDIMEKGGYDVEDKQQLQNLGRLVNSMTGRGYLGSLEKAGDFTNTIAFSARNVKSQLDTVLQPILGGATFNELRKGDNTGSAFVRKQAALNVLKVVVANALLMGVADWLFPKSVEFDPRSSDFGKIKIGNTRFDITGGLGSLVTLSARLATWSSKSSLNGKITELNEKNAEGKPKYGAKTLWDVLLNFGENKLSPVAGLVRDLMKGQTKDGQPITVGNTAVNLFAPLPVTNAVELYKSPNAANVVLGSIADALGISTNTYGGAKQIEADIEKAKQANNPNEVERLMNELDKQEAIDVKAYNPKLDVEGEKQKFLSLDKLERDKAIKAAETAYKKAAKEARSEPTKGKREKAMKLAEYQKQRLNLYQSLR